VSQFSTMSVPALPSLSLSQEEQALLGALGRLSLQGQTEMKLCEAYYLGEQVIKNLRIAVPEELEFLRTIVGWPSMAVDPYVSRVSADCFRLPDETDGNDHIAALMEANGFAAEQPLAVQDALVLSRAYWTVGTNPEGKDQPPLITAQSPLNTTVLYDLRGRTPKAMLSQFVDGGRQQATFMRAGMTVHLSVDDAGQWLIEDRDEHGYDFVPVVRMAHGARTTNRDGRSAITKALRSLTDGACRTLLGLEVARELFSAPGKVVLGAAQDAFTKSDGTAASVWDTYIHKTLGLERDENGELPQLHQWNAMDPSVFTKILDWYASSASGIVLSPPDDMGLYTQGNPTTAESRQAANGERNRRARGMQREFEPAMVKVAQMALAWENKGVLPEEFKRIAVDWNPVDEPNPVLVSDGISKQIAAGAIPERSDVTQKALGYSAVERRRMEQDWKREDARKAAAAAAERIATRKAAPTPQQGAPSGDAGQ
jgi:hypothetical protein